MLTAANAAYRAGPAGRRRRAPRPRPARPRARGLRRGAQGGARRTPTRPGTSSSCRGPATSSRARRPARRGRPAPDDARRGADPSPALSVHGVPGAPPPDVKAEEFETIAPMDFGDREAQPEADARHRPSSARGEPRDRPSPRRGAPVAAGRARGRCRCCGRGRSAPALARSRGRVRSPRARCRGASAHGPLGALPAWLCLMAAAACLLVAVARPRGVAAAIGRAGVDIVVLQDASASMHVQGRRRRAAGSGRWRFLRRLGDALSWDDDRIALAVFAHIATPQIRLTRDPNTVFFFLDHLGARPPFRLEDDTTWNTESRAGGGLGTAHPREGRGAARRARRTRSVFLLLSDGEAWSGEVAKSIARPRRERADLRRRRRHAGRRLAARDPAAARRASRCRTRSRG